MSDSPTLESLTSGVIINPQDFRTSAVHVSDAQNVVDFAAAEQSDQVSLAVRGPKRQKSLIGVPAVQQRKGGPHRTALFVLSARLAGACPEQHRLHSLDEDLQVEIEREMLDVIEIEGKLFDLFLGGPCIA